MRIKLNHFILFTLLFKSLPALSNTLTEDFTTSLQKDSGTAVWNFDSGIVHPSLQVTNYQAPAQATTSAAFDVGDGSHGIFDTTTYANFGTVVGSIITIDATLFPILKFSRFHLQAGYTLTSINGPLIIYSLGNVIIDGVIDCNGQTGGAASGINGGAGGIGRCGGRSGGVGGNATASGSSGLPTTGTVTGGNGGTYIGAAPGAGGGGGAAYAGNPGANGQNSTPATNTLGAGGSGVAGANHEFTILNGSPGGGGGSGSNTDGGAGGGGGGGTVVIHAVGDVTLSASGFILAIGGNGGTANSGGGGGGGGGGSVKIFTPKQLTLTSGTPIDVSGGTGSIPAIANAGDGGAGSFGRTWDISSTFSGAGSESHASGLISMGTVEYVVNSEFVISKSYDTQSTVAKFQSVTIGPASGSVQVEVAGSNDNFNTDVSGWLLESQMSQLEKKRYFKFRLTLNNSNPVVPVQVDSLSVNYDSGLVEDFQFKSGCAMITTNSLPSQPPLNLFMIGSLLLMPILVSLRLRSSQLKLVKSKK